LQHGADIDHVTNRGETAIYLAANRGNGHVVRELLKESPGLDQKVEQNHETVLHAAAAHCSLAVVKLLADAGADVYARDREGSGKETRETRMRTVILYYGTARADYGAVAVTKLLDLEDKDAFFTYAMVSQLPDTLISYLWEE
jgi:ankyrin repeat protein